MIIAVMHDGLHWKERGMFDVCPANAGNILVHTGRGNISGNDNRTLSKENKKLRGLSSEELVILEVESPPTKKHLQVL